MSEKRIFPRKKKRLIVDYDLDGVTYSGFTWDISYTGLFVASPNMPRIGLTITIRLHLPDGKKLECAGKVIRAKRVPAMYSSMEGATGFSLELVGYNEPYTRYFATL
ncbi:MAG: PilZ domain-containing protein [Thermoanaerobaculia bacterium]